MNRTRPRKERKVPAGIALRPTLWARIDRLAEEQDKSRNQVVEEVLSLHVPATSNSQESYAESHDSEDTVETF